jgi:cell division cycle 14
VLIDFGSQEFPDGSNPPLDLVRKFIGYVDRVIKAGGKVAVHCKAGLGRSGVM